MKLLAFTLSILLGAPCMAQHFNGTNNTTSTINRSGDVGIGTTTPIGKFHVNGNTVFSGPQGAFVLTNAYQSGDHFIAFAPNSGGTYQTNWDWSKALGLFGNSGELQKSVTSNSDIAYSVVGSSSIKNLKIFGSGNIETNGDASILGKVTIGNVSTPSGYKLYVDEGILTEKLKVALTSSLHWADFVFNDDYKLRSIESVDKFIKKYNHLPDMPSGEELFRSGGVDVFEMLKLQQQKIEELTLYIIDLNNAIKRSKE